MIEQTKNIQNNWFKPFSNNCQVISAALQNAISINFNASTKMSADASVGNQISIEIPIYLTCNVYGGTPNAQILFPFEMRPGVPRIRIHKPQTSNWLIGLLIVKFINLCARVFDGTHTYSDIYNLFCFRCKLTLKTLKIL
jgi:hypothetical protein